MEKMNLRKVVGWITAAISLLIIAFWSYWGINEAFHEGWYQTSLLQNLSMTFVQYLSIPIIFLVLALVAMSYKRIGFGLFIISGIFAMFFFKSNAGRFLIFIPLILFALGFYFGEYRHKKIITWSFAIIPLLIILSFGIPQLIRVENRFNDNNFGTRTITGNNIELIWAPQGIGFPLEGTDWQTAKDNCARLKLRLPSRDEIVRSLTKKDKNAMGLIDNSGTAQYDTRPDKETPLWNPYSQIIYYWTNESKNEKQAYLVAYNGFILDRNKNSGANYQGYRCVKD